MIISYSDITETVYNSLTSLSNTNEVYEGENIELNMRFNVNLSTLLVNVILENNGSENIENINCEIGRDGYIWVYHIKNQKKNSLQLLKIMIIILLKVTMNSIFMRRI